MHSLRFTREEFTDLFGEVRLPPGATRSLSSTLSEHRPFDFEVEVFYRSTRGGLTYSELVSGRCGSRIDANAPPPALTFLDVARTVAPDHDTVAVTYRVRANGGLFLVTEWSDLPSLRIVGENWGGAYREVLPTTPGTFERSVRVVVPRDAGGDLSLRIELVDVLDRVVRLRVDLAEP
ncbi:MAG: hypothetical protein IT357_14645 [Gemmatimonadaceae bacterium]|nr:hypothetical protein [Gemmatimonadaceae bacterium]